MSTAVCTSGYYGREFYATFPPMRNPTPSADMVLEIYNPGLTASKVDVLISAPGPGTAITNPTFTLDSGARVTRVIPKSLATSANSVENKGVFIYAGGDISVFLRSKQDVGCSGTQLVPAHSMGWNYYVMTSLPLADPSKRPFIVIVGTHDRTFLSVELPAGRSIVFTFDGIKYGKFYFEECEV